MIRRDYIVRMIEEFARALRRIQGLKRGEQWRQAGAALDDEFQKLTGTGAQAVARMSETELFAAIVRGEATSAVRDKALLLTALLHEAAEVAIAESRFEEGREYYLKALHLQLDVLAREEVFEWPEFVPGIETLVLALRDAPLPERTNARLMQHYERARDYAKAEDALHALLDAAPENQAVVEFGLAFYQRLAAQSDETLAAANLPRAEVEEGLEALRARYHVNSA